jgi:hypothetical protein
MSGQMCWLFSSNHDSQPILNLQERSFDPWLPYTAFPQYKVPDYLISGGSKGWSTCQKLIKAGWMLMPTAQLRDTAVEPEAQRVLVKPKSRLKEAFYLAIMRRKNSYRQNLSL